MDNHSDELFANGLAPLSDVDAWTPDPVEGGVNSGVVLDRFFYGLGSSSSGIATVDLDVMTTGSMASHLTIFLG